MRYNNKSAYIPTLRLGVCITRDPAPIPECLGVPGTITFAFDPEAVFTASASSAACLAVLCKVGTLANENGEAGGTYASRCFAISVSSSARFENSLSACRLNPRSSKFFSFTE
ncbi:hypothetical protein PILCRDRAFT_486848 [Piloderma croceum F 1598]|uniref:Uncharacterized protein n=1 Tax=Piloderma croceum (strain F 1598) TaxID=765440 RepID=A0A0C3FPQ7_PILCF|nr:hypothetical protein PILCRDRAFT_486848 [Piloderma croceum F 1598]